jgi:diguanylate cyclase
MFKRLHRALPAMMNYRESVEQSAEYLRLALPLMSRQNAALHPVSYAVWYEYVAGSNKPLKAAIDEMTRGGTRLDEAATVDLFHRFIADFDEQLTQRLSSGFDRVMAEMEQSAVHAEQRADSFGKELAQWSSALTGEEANADVPADVGKLLACTREMQGAIATLKESLDNSLKEIQTLRIEVDQAREEALTDGLTGLANRRGFDLALEACLAAVPSLAPGPCLLIADIDHFKNVNDQYGHLFGDKVIRSIAHILKANVKGKDTAARYGGEEFVVLLPETALDDACRLAEKIRLTIAASRVRRADNRQEIGQITVSLGVAGYRPGESASRFVERGDIALYVAKNQGRNRVSVAATYPAEGDRADTPLLLSAELVAEPPERASGDVGGR